MKSYTCNNCNEKQTTVIQVQEATNYYEYTLATCDSELRDTDGVDHIGWYCPDCDEELSPGLSKKIQKAIWG